jgi:hypothetical protein
VVADGGVGASTGDTDNRGEAIAPGEQVVALVREAAGKAVVGVVEAAMRVNFVDRRQESVDPLGKQLAQR